MTTAKDAHAPTASPLQVSWERIAPFWPLHSLVAVNPLQGFEDLSFEKALCQGQAYFQQRALPNPMQAINRITMKWMQAFCDEGQALIPMPYRHLGFLKALLILLPFDPEAHQHNTKKKEWIRTLPPKPLDVIDICLAHLRIPQKEHAQFLTLVLTTLPGWAAHVRYQHCAKFSEDAFPLTQEVYTAVRLILTALLWGDAKKLLTWHTEARQSANQSATLEHIKRAEKSAHTPLLKQLAQQKQTPQKVQQRAQNLPFPEAQFVFCMDVRSESFRRAIEAVGSYETFGFAGSFGLPLKIQDPVSSAAYASCPAIVSPQYTVHNHTNSHRETLGKYVASSITNILPVPSLFTSILGLFQGFWMVLHTLFPFLTDFIQRFFSKKLDVAPITHDMPFDVQCGYAENTLRTLGLTKHFAPLVVLCGHDGRTHNDTYASMLACGACGGHSGGPNAAVLADICNQKDVRKALRKKGVMVPDTTHFLAATHSTTTDDVTFQKTNLPDVLRDIFDRLQTNLKRAQQHNCQKRAQKMGMTLSPSRAVKLFASRAKDWAEIKPEQGLARCTALVIGPRWLTKNIDLEGRCFLYSYDTNEDPDGKLLSGILTGPAVVAHWINAQYLLSTLDPVAYGAGSKVTQNVTGKFSVMQGAASDLMYGLPLQSVYKNAKTPYHEPTRLLIAVYANNKSHTCEIIKAHPPLAQLVKNDWIHLVHLTPDTKPEHLQPDFSWLPKNL